MEEKSMIEKVDGKEIKNVTPLNGLRKMIADHMKESLLKAPQATISTKADMSALIELKKRYSENGVKISYTDIFIKIASIALSIHPELNSSLIDGKIYQYRSINVGVAIGTDQALFVPVVKNAKDKSLLEVSEELKIFIQKATEGRFAAEDFVGGTFTLSNLGMFDIDAMTPILNTPQAAILSIGATRKELVVEDDNSIRIIPRSTLSLTIDHAVMDGLPAAKFIETFCSIMKNPLEYFK